jgi:hypothetical protein
VSNNVPPLLSPSQVGRACRMSRRSAKTLLRGAGILEKHANGRWYVGETRLRERLPDVYDRVYVAFELGLTEEAPR